MSASERWRRSAPIVVRSRHWRSSPRSLSSFPRSWPGARDRAPSPSRPERRSRQRPGLWVGRRPTPVRRCYPARRRRVPRPMLVIAVEGKVRHPGLVRLPPGSRIADAIDAAGGAEPGTDLSFVNLAQKVVDGELIVIGVTPPPGVAATAGPAHPAPAGPAPAVERHGPAGRTDQSEHRDRGRPRHAARHRSGTGPTDHRLPHPARGVPQRRRVAQRVRHRRREVRGNQGSGDGVTASGWPDVRLAGVAAGAWLAAVAALHSSTAGAIWLAVGALLCGVAVWFAPIAVELRGRVRVGCGRFGRRAGDADHAIACRRGRSCRSGGAMRWAVLAFLIGAVCGAGATAAQLVTAHAQPLAGLARTQTRATLSLTVSGDPHPVGRPGIGPPTYGFDAHLTRIATAGATTQLSARVFVLASNAAWAGLLPGQRTTVGGRLGVSDGADLDAAVVSVTAAADAGRSATVDPTDRRFAARRTAARVRRLADPGSRPAPRSDRRRHHASGSGRGDGVPYDGHDASAGRERQQRRHDHRMRAADVPVVPGRTDDVRHRLRHRSRRVRDPRPADTERLARRRDGLHRPCRARDRSGACRRARAGGNGHRSDRVRPGLGDRHRLRAVDVRDRRSSSHRTALARCVAAPASAPRRRRGARCSGRRPGRVLTVDRRVQRDGQHRRRTGESRCHPGGAGRDDPRGGGRGRLTALADPAPRSWPGSRVGRPGGSSLSRSVARPPRMRSRPGPAACGVRWLLAAILAAGIVAVRHRPVRIIAGVALVAGADRCGAGAGRRRRLAAA